MLVKDYGPSMAVLQALGDMPLGSLEHDGGVGIPAFAGQRQVLGIDSFRYSQSQETAYNQSHARS